MSNESNISYKQELFRKAIHLASLSIPICYIFLPKELMLSVILPLTLLFLIFDILSKKVQVFSDLLMRFFGDMLRPHEKKGHGLFNGATWVLISASICIIIFPRIIAITSFTILIISDLSAALIGRKFGRHKFFDKSLEGTLSFILSASAIVFIYYELFNMPFSYLMAGLIGAIVGGIVEAISKVIRIDDNLSIPVSVGITMIMVALYYSGLGQPFVNLMD